MSFRVVVAGLGYFSRFHLSAWEAAPEARLVGLCDTDPDRLEAAAQARDVDTAQDLAALVQRTKPDIVDIVAPPPAHAALIRAALGRGRTIVCQKPFCTSLDEAIRMADAAETAGAQLVVHENFRFQPWHREVRDFLASGRMGQVWQARFDLRPGDGRGSRAYLDRQPAFRSMPRFLLRETGVHFIDLFRWYFGPVTSVYAETRRLNPSIAGEDAGLLSCHHASGVWSVFDGNRLADHRSDNPRRTMGEMRIEGGDGVLTLGGDGRLAFRTFGDRAARAVPVTYPVDEDAFGGGCVAALIAGLLEALAQGRTPENTARDYLHVMEVVEAAYESACSGIRVALPSPG